MDGRGGHRADEVAADRPARRINLSTAAAGTAAGAGGLVTLLVGLLGLPWSTAAGVLAALLAITAGGAALWRGVLRSARGPELLVFGTATGLALVGLGTVLSGVTGIFWVRWIPVAVPLVGAGVVAVRHPSRSGPGRGGVARKTPERTGPGWAWWGAAGASALLAVSVARYVSTLPRATDPWSAWYVDLPWHMAFTAEALERSPQVYPWVPDVTLGYTWSFSAALGGWGSLTGVSAEDLLVRAAPALLMALLPAATLLLTWRISGSRTASAAAPVVVVLARAPMFSFQDAMTITPQWLIPNRDYSNLFVLVSLYLLVAALRGHVPGDQRPRLLPLAGLVALAAFTAASSKGSALPALTGGAGALLLLALVRRGGRGRAVVLTAAVAGGMLAAQFGVTRSLSYLRWDPLTFLGGQEPPGTGGLVPVAVLALLAAVLVHVVATAWSVRDEPYSTGLLTLAGAGAGGVTATAVFGHPGLSQLYFLHAVWPLLCCAMCVCTVVWSRRLGQGYLVGAALAAGICWALVRPPGADVRAWAWGAAGLLVVVVALHTWPLLALGRAGVGELERPRRVAVAVTTSLGAAFAVQVWGLPHVVLPATTPSAVQQSAALSAGQYDVLRTLHRMSEAHDLVMTNKHCQSGSVSTYDCDPRWFAVSAFAERRVLVEGWSYTRLSAGVPTEDEYWRPGLLRENDGFLADPDIAACHRFTELGVRWVYIDTREPWSPELARFADVVAQVPDAVLLRLRPGCG